MLHVSEFSHLDLQRVWSDPPPTVDWVLPGLAVGTVGNVVGPGGLGKSFLMLATALSVAIGGDVGGIWGEPAKPGRCVFLSLEDPDPLLRIRLHALAAHLTEDEKQRAPDGLRVLPAAGRGFALASQVAGRQPKLSDRFEGFKGYLTEFAPRLLVVDTLNRALGGLAENDAGTMGWVLAQLEGLARDVGCAVVVCHHVSKVAVSSGSGGDAHAARGSSAITDNARWQSNLSAPSEQDGKARAVSRKTHVRLEITKANYRGALPGRWLRRTESGVLCADETLAVAKSKLGVVPSGKLAGTRSA